MKIALAHIAHACSGDKADWVDFGLFAWNDPGYRVIAREATAQRVQAHFAPWLVGQVDCWQMPNILAVKLVLRGALQGGGARNLRLDNLGKSMAGALLRMEAELTQAEWDSITKTPAVGWWPEAT